MTIEKTGASSAQWGEVVKYTITFINSGGDAKNVRVSDSLPPGTEFVDASPDYDYNKYRRVVSWLFDEVKSGEKITLWVKLRITGECGAVLTNRASLIAQNWDKVIESEVETKIECIEVYHHNFFSGYPDRSFKPSNSITRAEVASSVARALGLKWLEYGADINRIDFPDVNSSFWGYGHIEAVFLEKLVVGYPDGTFKPNRKITRAEAAAIFFNLLKLKPEYPLNSTFRDVNMNHWAYGVIEAVAKKGIIKGYPDGTFRPDRAITRAEFVTIACKTLGRGPFETPETIFISPYPDVYPTHWAYHYILEASINHVVINPERQEWIIEIPSKKIPIYSEWEYSKIYVPQIGETIFAIVPVDGLDPDGSDPDPRDVVVRIIRKEVP